MATYDVWQHTVATQAFCAGVGVHSGVFARVALLPAPVNTGVVFVRTDVVGRDNRVPARSAFVRRTQLNTEIVNAEGVSVSTIEHLMAALSACGVDNVVVEIDGPECPIMDGSALPFVQMIDRAGRRPQEAARAFLEVVAPVEVRFGEKLARIEPAASFEVDFEIRYENPVIGRQRVVLEVDAESFRGELAAARTFGFLHEVEQLRAAGLARGGSLDNAVVVDGDRVMNPEGLRMEREFVRHKALDAVGDLYTLGAPVIGRFTSVCGGHALNNALCAALLQKPAAYRMVTPAEAIAEAV